MDLRWHLRSAVFFWGLLQSRCTECSVSAPEQASCDAGQSSGPGIALLQKHAHIGYMATTGEDTEKLFATTKVVVPSTTTLVIIFALLALLCCGIAKHLSQKQEKRGATCMCCGFCGGLLLFLACALLVMKFYLMSISGPEPAGPIEQAPFATQVTVSTVVPFKIDDINEDGPVRTAYIEGMQSLLDEQTGKPGVHTVKVLDVEARPDSQKKPSGSLLADAVHTQEASPAAAELAVKSSRAASAHSTDFGSRTAEASLLDVSQVRVALVYFLAADDAAEQAAKKDLLDNEASSKLGEKVQEAAKKLEDDKEASELFKAVASGKRKAATKAKMEVAVSTSVRCQASHQLNSDIRAAGRVLIKKQERQIMRELQGLAERQMGGFFKDGSVKVAERCNDPDQDEAIQLCIAAETLWVDFVTSQALSGSKKKLESNVCDAGCALGKTLTQEKGKVIATVNENLPAFELDSDTVSKISCRPILAKGSKCEPCA